MDERERKWGWKRVKVIFFFYLMIFWWPSFMYFIFCSSSWCSISCLPGSSISEWNSQLSTFLFFCLFFSNGWSIGAGVFLLLFVCETIDTNFHPPWSKCFYISIPSCRSLVERRKPCRLQSCLFSPKAVCTRTNWKATKLVGDLAPNTWQLSSDQNLHIPYVPKRFFTSNRLIFWKTGNWNYLGGPTFELSRN